MEQYKNEINKFTENYIKEDNIITNEQQSEICANKIQENNTEQEIVNNLQFEDIYFVWGWFEEEFDEGEYCSYQQLLFATADKKLADAYAEKYYEINAHKDLLNNEENYDFTSTLTVVCYRNIQSTSADIITDDSNGIYPAGRKYCEQQWCLEDNEIQKGDDLYTVQKNNGSFD